MKPRSEGSESTYSNELKSTGQSGRSQDPQVPELPTLDEFFLHHRDKAPGMVKLGMLLQAASAILVSLQQDEHRSTSFEIAIALNSENEIHVVKQAYLENPKRFIYTDPNSLKSTFS